jgi:hypothetical protein
VVKGVRRDLLLDLHLDHIPDLEEDLGDPCAISRLALVECMYDNLVHSVKGRCFKLMDMTG